MTTSHIYDDLSNEWDATKRYAAGADADLIIASVGTNSLRWATTDNTTPPTHAPEYAQIIPRAGSRPRQILTGQYIWFAGSGAVASVEVA